MTRLVFAIDPGNVESAFVSFDPVKRVVYEKDTVPNADLLDRIPHYVSVNGGALCAIEMIASYGMAVGAEVFDTCVWIGRFIERWNRSSPYEAERVFRRDVKLHLCGTSKAKDANVRQALIDMFGPGKDRAIGKAKSPGPLYGVSGDVWAALAVAVTFAANRPDLCGTR